MAKEVKTLHDGEFVLVDGGARTKLEKTINDVKFDSETGQITFYRTNNDGTAGAPTVIDLPTELIVKSGFYNANTKQIELTLANSEKIIIDAAALASGLTQYTADNVTLKFMTTEDSSGTFAISDTYKNMIDTSYSITKSIKDYVKFDDIATESKAGLVKIGSTLKYENGVINLKDTNIAGLEKFVSTENNIRIGITSTDAHGSQENLFHTFDNSVFKINDSKIITLSDELNNRLDSLAYASSLNDYVKNTGGNITGELSFVNNDNPIITTSDDYVYFKSTYKNNEIVFGIKSDLNKSKYSLDEFITRSEGITNVTWENVNNEGIINFYRADSTDPILTINLPLESIIKTGYFNNETNSVVLVTTDDSEIIIPVESLMVKIYNADGISIVLDKETNTFSVSENFINQYAKRIDLDDYLKTSTAHTLYQPLGNYATKSELSEHVSNADQKYVKLTGDTLTGHLAVPSLSADVLNVSNIINDSNRITLIHKTDETTSRQIFNADGTGIHSYYDDTDTNYALFVADRYNLMYTPEIGSMLFRVGLDGIFYKGDKLLTYSEKYTLPKATYEILGGITLASNDLILRITDGKLSTDMSEYTTAAKIAETYQIKGDYALRSELSSIYNYRGSVQNFDNLPTSNLKTGDVYSVVNGFILGETSPNGVPAGEYNGGTSFIWSEETHSWHSLGGVFNTSEFVTYGHLSTDYFNRNYIMSNYSNNNKLAATYLTLTDADKYYLKKEDYDDHGIASYTHKGIVSIDNNGYLNDRPTISITDGSIYLTKDNITNALGFTPKDIELNDATANTKGLVSIDTNTLTVKSGKLSVSATNINNALGFTPISQSITDRLYISKTKAEEIGGVKTFIANNRGYYDGANEIGTTINSNIIWNKDTYTENIILPQVGNIDELSHKHIKVNKVKSITNGVAELEPIITIRENGRIYKTDGDKYDEYVLASEMKVLQDRIVELENRIAGLAYVAIVISTFTSHVSEIEVGTPLNNLVLNWETNSTPKEIKLTVGSVDYSHLITDNSTKSVEVVFDEPIYDDIECVLSVTGTGGEIITKTLNIDFLNKIYYGASSEELTANLILGLSSKFDKNTDINLTVNAGNNEYIYFAQPATKKEPVFEVGGFAGGFEYVDELVITNEHGYSQTYNVYRSENHSLGITEFLVK